MIRSLVSALRQKVKDPLLDRIYDRLMRTKPQLGTRTPFGADELKLVREALLSQNLCCIGGQMVTALESEFAEAYGSPYGVASTSGTAAIHVALGALDLNPGDEVITAPITDLGTVIPILYQGGIPVFADIDHTYNMDPADVERKITPRTRAIVAVHLFGNPCDMDAMVEIARRHRVALIEDCAQAHFTEYNGRFCGTIGDIGCFSFQQSKHMTTGDGGMTLTGNKAYYERMKLFADKGYARKGWGSRAYLFHAPNYRMTELVGAVGLAQLRKVRSVVAKRHELGEHMTRLLQNVDGVRPAPTTAGGRHSYWLYPMAVSGADADTFAAELKKLEVQSSVRYTGKAIYLCTESLTSKKTYGDSQYPFSARPDRRFDYTDGLCPRAERALDELVCLPLNETWTHEEVERVAKAVSAVAKRLAKPATVIAAPAVTSPEVTAVSHVQPVAAAQGAAQLGIGIVGCGQMGRLHLEAYKKNPGCKVVAVADSDFARAQQFADEVGARAYRTHTEMLAAERLDGVSICTVPVSHRQIVLDALRARTHVLCEKPLATTVDDAQEMVAVAAAHKLLLLPAFKFRFYDEVRNVKEVIDRGSLGRILSFRLMFGGYIDMAGTWYGRRELAGGGIIMDNGPHALDLIRYLFGEVRAVTATAARLQELEVEDTAHLSITMAADVVGTADVSWSTAVPARAYLEIYGEDGAALVDNEGLTYRCKAWKEWKRVPNQVPGSVAFARQIDHFVAAIGGQPPTTVTNHDGFVSQTLIRAAYASLEAASQLRPAPPVADVIPA